MPMNEESDAPLPNWNTRASSFRHEPPQIKEKGREKQQKCNKSKKKVARWHHLKLQHWKKQLLHFVGWRPPQQILHRARARERWRTQMWHQRHQHPQLRTPTWKSSKRMNSPRIFTTKCRRVWYLHFKTICIVLVPWEWLYLATTYILHLQVYLNIRSNCR